MKSVIDISYLSTEELDEIIHTALDIIEDPAKYADACRGKQLATLFFEPSTRTRMSFESAMLSLGGSVISMTDGATSSVSKGESVADTVRTVSCYADIIAMRHPKEGAALVAAKNADIPVINAGDGGHCHPTQTLADLLTIYREKGGFNDLTIGFCGDLKYGRTVHSLINAMVRYRGVKFVLISPEELSVPAYSKEIMKAAGSAFEETGSLEGSLPKLDVLYMTRIQRERFEDPMQYERLKDSYCLDEAKMKLAKPDCIVLHPLPRVNEISVRVDSDPRAAYFRQAKNGKFMRMALILKLLDEAEKNPAHEGLPEGTPSVYRCANPRCISHSEREFISEFDADGRCIYCETLSDQRSAMR